MTDDIFHLEIVELARLLHSRRLSPVELTEAMLRRIEQLDARLHAYVLTTPELALAQAREAEREIGRRRIFGPLHGVPIGLKDLCFTAGIRTAAGTTIHRDFVPDFDGTVVARLRDAGAITLGKLQLTEGAFTDHHPAITVPVNPWHRDHWSGASSSGSGVATAAGLCYGSIGSDTGGSIRFPASANGVTGLKPTWGRVSRYGAFALAPSLDHLGPMCRSAADTGVMLGAIAGPDANDPTARHDAVPEYVAGDDRVLTGVRVGVDPEYNADGVDATMIRVTEEAMRVLRRLGADVRSVRFPDPAQTIDDWGPSCAVEAAVVHERTFPARRAEYGSVLAGFLDLARGVDVLEYEKVLLRRREFTGRVATLFESIDLLLIPGQAIASPTVAQMANLGDDAELLGALVRFTAPFDMTGSPTITLPAGFTGQRTPVSVQLVSAHMNEALLVRAGRAFQHETDWHRRRPPGT